MQDGREIESAVGENDIVAVLEKGVLGIGPVRGGADIPERRIGAISADPRVGDVAEINDDRIDPVVAEAARPAYAGGVGAEGEAVHVADESSGAVGEDFHGSGSGG